MRVLLDTHVFLWSISDDPRLGPTSRALIADQAEQVMLSLASLWEIAIKHGLGRGDMPLSAGQAHAWMEQSGVRLLPLAVRHLLVLEQLPHHHRDPFDRVLVAQALSEPLVLITADRALMAYGCSCLDARG